MGTVCRDSLLADGRAFRKCMSTTPASVSASWFTWLQCCWANRRFVAVHSKRSTRSTRSRSRKSRRSPPPPPWRSRCCKSTGPFDRPVVRAASVHQGPNLARDETYEAFWIGVVGGGLQDNRVGAGVGPPPDGLSHGRRVPGNPDLLSQVVPPGTLLCFQAPRCSRAGCGQQVHGDRVRLAPPASEAPLFDELARVAHAVRAGAAGEDRPVGDLPAQSERAWPARSHGEGGHRQRWPVQANLVQANVTSRRRDHLTAQQGAQCHHVLAQQRDRGLDPYPYLAHPVLDTMTHPHDDPARE